MTVVCLITGTSHASHLGCPLAYSMRGACGLMYGSLRAKTSVLGGLNVQSKSRLQDQFIQETDHSIDTNCRCFLNKHINKSQKLKNYLISMPRCVYLPILKLQSCNHKLAIERGRCSNIPREHRYCYLRNQNMVRDEYHLVLQCQHRMLVQYQEQYIPKYHRNRPSIDKSVTLMTQVIENRKVAKKLGFFFKNSFALIK